MTKSRADNSGQNGFQFQAVAAISLLLDHLYDFSKIKNEAALEDIVIILSNNDHILAQAKSSHDNEESSNALKYLKKGLITLSEGHQESNSHRLIYITNIRKMLGNRTICDDFVNGKTIWFSEMCEVNKKLLIKYAPENFNFDLFGIQFLKYIGDDDKDKWILEKMKELFFDNDNLKNLKYKDVFKTWKLYLLDNACKKDPTTYCDKEKMIWGMIIHRIDSVNEEIINESDIDYSEISNKYSQLIEILSGKFQTISRIYGDYQNISRKDSTVLEPCEFASKYWNLYTDLITDGCHEQRINKIIIQSIIENVIYKHELLLSIRKEFNI